MIGNASCAGIFLISVAGICPAVTYTGSVTDSKSGVPVENVRVSIGYTDVVARTDANGRFSLSDGSAVTSGRYSRVSEKMDMYMKNGCAVVTLAEAPSVHAVQLFSIDGKCLYRNDIGGQKRTVTISGFSHGVYLMRLMTGENTFTSFRINTLIDSHIAKRLNGGPARKTIAEASSSDDGSLLFQHGSYYPVRMNAVNGTTDYSITMKPDPRAPIFNESVIHTYSFTMTKDDSLKMEHDAVLENFVPAQFTFNDSLIGEIGIRYKGSTYSLPNCFDSAGTRADKPVCRKISLKLKFNKYVDGQKFYSMKRLNLHSMSADNTKMHDALSYGLFREMGIYSPGTAFAKVYINGAFQGVFIAVEAPDDRFAKSRWPEDPDGNMYKEKWPISSNRNYYIQGLKTNEDGADVTRMVDFNKTLTAADATTFVNTVSGFIDFNYFLRYIAVDRVIHNADGIMTWYVQENWTGNHNYYFYQETAADGRFWIIPWDLHVTYSRTDPIVDDLGIPDWNVAPADCEPVPVWGENIGIPAHCDPLIGMTADLLWSQFVRISEHMLDNEFTVEHQTAKIDYYKSLLDTVIAKDPYVDHDTWVRDVAGLRKDITTLNSSFDDYIHHRTVAADTSGFTQPFDGPGYLEPDKLNNFEYPPSPDGYEWAYRSASENTKTSLVHDTAAPLRGTADLCFSFVFNTAPGTGTYREWTNTVLEFDGTKDLGTLEEISVNIKSDSNRYLWLFIQSPVYNKKNIATQYGWWTNVTSKDTIRTFRISDATYPTWETEDPPDVLDSVLSEVTGIGFGPVPHFSDDGELTTIPDSGYLRIDNIRFGYR